jgi:hypothetical protein
MAGTMTPVIGERHTTVATKAAAAATTTTPT